MILSSLASRFPSPWRERARFRSLSNQPTIRKRSCKGPVALRFSRFSYNRSLFGCDASVSGVLRRMKSLSIRVTAGIVGSKLFPSVPPWMGADVNGRENDRKSAVNGDLLAKSGFGNGGRAGKEALSDQDGASEVRRERAGKKKKKWILEKFFRNAIAFVMMFRLVRRLHLACTFRDGERGRATVEAAPAPKLCILSSRRRRRRQRRRRRLLKLKLTHSVDVVFGTGKSPR